MITIRQQAAAINHAKAVLERLEKQPGTTLAQLGNARDQLNIVANSNNPQQVDAALVALDAIATDTN